MFSLIKYIQLLSAVCYIILYMITIYPALLINFYVLPVFDGNVVSEST